MVVFLFFSAAKAQTEKKVYNIEVAGITVGKMTAVKNRKSEQVVNYTLTSDVKINFLVYLLKIFYQVNEVQSDHQLVSAKVDAHTNKGDFYTRTEKRESGYHVESKQHKSEVDKMIAGPVDLTLINLYFEEPVGHKRVFAEYYGDFFTITKLSEGKYSARLDKHHDTYFYKNGKLMKIIKENPVKDFAIVLVE